MDHGYNRTAIALHWVVGTLIVGQLVFGWMLGDIPRNTPERGLFINLHKSTGIVIGLLVLLRMGWRFLHPAPHVPLSIGAWQARAAKATHFALYACMLVIPLSGYLAANFSKHGIKLFNTVKLAPWGVDDKLVYAIFKQTHTLAVWLLVALITLHLLAVAKHMLIDRDHILARMWPSRRRDRLVRRLPTLSHWS